MFVLQPRSAQMLGISNFHQSVGINNLGPDCSFHEHCTFCCLQKRQKKLYDIWLMLTSLRNWAVLGCIGLYWAVLGYPGLYWAVLGNS